MPERFHDLVRAHGGIENRRHGVLDVGLHADPSRHRKAKGSETRARLRNRALTLARLAPSKGSMRGKLKRARWDNGDLTIMRSQVTKIQMR